MFSQTSRCLFRRGVAITGTIVVLMLSPRPLRGQHHIDWYTVDCGGVTTLTDGLYSASGTIGQADATDLLTDGAHQLYGGFWIGTPSCECRGDVAADGFINGRDVQPFTACLLNNAGCDCADMDASGSVTLDDVQLFVDTILAGTCPP